MDDLPSTRTGTGGTVPFRKAHLMQSLTAETLSSISADVPASGYDRRRVGVGIVHIGVGGFHRAHQAMYLDRLMNQGKALDWGICGVGVLPTDRGMKEAMAAQDCLYTLVVKHPDGTLEPRVVGSMVDYLLAPDDPEAVIEKMADARTRIVSLTVTEGGYNVDAVTGDFDETNPDILDDLAPGAAPRTTFGLVTEALVRRRQRDLPPFTIMSCDNIQGNGDVPNAASSPSPHSEVPSSVRGCRRRFGSPTAWSTGSPR
jgi:mannitol 2-dehydrogenase